MNRNGSVRQVYLKSNMEEVKEGIKVGELSNDACHTACQDNINEDWRNLGRKTFIHQSVIPKRSFINL